jgi:hypothetical protein
LNDSNATLMRHIQSCPIARVSAVFLTLTCVACSSQDDGSGDVPAFSAFGGSSTSPGTGSGAINTGVGGGNAQSGATGGNGPASPSSEQPAAGNGTAIGSSAGGGGSANGSAGSSMVAAGGNSMAAPDPAAGAGGQVGMPTTNECEGGALFCEDFDGLALGALQAGFNGLVPERTVSVVADPVRGQVLQVQAGPGYGSKAGVFLNGVALPDNSYFGRMFVNVAEFPVAEADHWVIVEATGDGGDQVRPVGGQFQRWAPGSDGPSAGDWTDWQQSTVATVAGAWECVEWQMNGANGANDIVLWVDDVQVQPLDRPAFSFPAINRLWFGWVVYQMGAPSQYDVRIDDIVISTERVGCN